MPAYYKDHLMIEEKILKDFNSFKTLGNLFYQQSEKFKNHTFITFWKDEKLEQLSWKDFQKKVQTVSFFLRTKQIYKQDQVAIIADNSPETLASIIAIVSSGAICCPIHKTLSVTQKLELINSNPYKLILASEKEYQQLLAKIGPFKTLININQALDNQHSDNPSFFDVVKSVSSEDIAYIMLSSGTTGNQKGVILTHRNILFNQLQVRSILSFIDEKDTYLSFLPFSHSYGGLAELYQVILNGACYHFCKGTEIDTLFDEFNRIKPTVFQAVPRIWEKLMKSLATTPTGSIKQKLGLHLHTGFSAGAPLDKNVVEFFFNAGIPIYQGYGLTETSPSVAIASPEEFINTDSARILPFVDIKIAEDSEILIKGPNVTQGYFNQPEITDNCFTDGFLKTGDLGTIISGRSLTISGRKKNLLILSTGQKVFPEKTEEQLCQSHMVYQAVLTGDNMPFISCIMIPEKDKLINFAAQNNINSNNFYELCQNPLVLQHFQEFINTVNRDLSAPERIKKFYLCPESFTEEELTPTLKVKKDIFLKNRAHLLKTLYCKEL